MRDGTPLGKIEGSWCRLRFTGRANRFYIKKFDSKQQAYDYRDQLRKHSNIISSAVIHT